MEDYHKKIHIEGKIAFDIAKNVVLPQVLCAYSNALKTNEMAKTQGFYAVDGYARELGEKLKELEAAVAQMEAALGDKHEAILDAMANLRIIVDKIESIVPDEKWPLPKYREMLFIY
jgi:glutamine synthetase